ncbi:MAG: sulfotransferase [Anaerolineae bacterium]|nr:sulfotransferase [Anaerolineae bacterium]
MITIIGRGHSGTRAISHTLYASGVYMGEMLNPSGDLIPPHDMYEACRVFGRYVKWNGGLSWDFSQVMDMPIPDEFTELLTSFLKSVIEHRGTLKGWKIPETTLVYPWIVRLFPEMHYVFWIRNPRDCILGRHITDDMRDFGIDRPDAEDERHLRAISWKYQYDLVKATPKPEKWMEVRFEDFIFKQEETLQQLEDFLDIPLARIIVRPETVDRWKKDDGINYYDFFEPAMREYNYEIPEDT